MSVSRPTPDEVTAAGRSVERGRPLYLDVEPDPLFAFLHVPVRGEQRRTGVVLCAPFGWDELATHRSLRVWAAMLAQAGFPTVRFDLPATGDSGGAPRESGLLERWTSATGAVAAWLREDRACERIVAAGISLGGMVACRALAEGAAIDDLLLWAVPARGRLLVREVRTFARVVRPDVYDAEQSDEEPEVQLDDGSVNAAGFLLSAETVAALEQVDLSTLAIPDGAGRRVLMLGRDGINPDRRLREHFEDAGVAVTVMDGLGFTAMANHPQLSTPPRETFEEAIAWLAEEQPATGAPRGSASLRLAPATSESIELVVDGTTVREAPFDVLYEGSLLSGVLAEPVAPEASNLPCAVFLNAGAVRRIGPHRMWVEVARRWAARGVPTLRLDIVGLGDSDDNPTSDSLDDEFLLEAIGNQALVALDALEARGYTNGFILGGLCSGAYWGLHATLADERIVGLCMINLRVWFWSDELGAARDARRTRTLLSRRELRQIAAITLANRSKISRMLRTKLRAARRGPAGGRATSRLGDQIAVSLDLLRDRGVETLLQLARGEPVFDDFVEFGLTERLEEWPTFRLGRIEIHDHVVRPLRIQRDVHAALDGTLTRLLARRYAEPERVGGDSDA